MTRSLVNKNEFIGELLWYKRNKALQGMRKLENDQPPCSNSTLASHQVTSLCPIIDSFPIRDHSVIFSSDLTHSFFHFGK